MNKVELTRRTMNLSIPDLAAKAGVGWAVISGIEHNIPVKKSTAERVAKALGIHIRNLPISKKKIGRPRKS